MLPRSHCSHSLLFHATFPSRPILNIPPSPCLTARPLFLPSFHSYSCSRAPRWCRFFFFHLLLTPGSKRTEPRIHSIPLALYLHTFPPRPAPPSAHPQGSSAPVQLDSDYRVQITRSSGSGLEVEIPLLLALAFVFIFHNWLSQHLLGFAVTSLVPIRSPKRTN
jgi:hypothetical protein